jgi:tRNA threonylcarbamoyladenosine biosynthesis protein TsaE
MATFISHSPDETAALGETWGRAAAPGLVIGLTGDLGAGKTQLVKGLARGLGIPERVHSPTFALVNTYAGGRLPLYHLDLYRLETPDQVLAAGLEEYLHPDGLTVIEWAERWFPGGQKLVAAHPRLETLPVPAGTAGWRWVHIEALSPTERRITYENLGA